MICGIGHWNPEGQAMAHAWDDYESCEAVVSSVFPLLRQAVQEVSGPQVATASGALEKTGFLRSSWARSTGPLLDANRENLWLPGGAWAIRRRGSNGCFPGEFFHLVTYRGHGRLRWGEAGDSGWGLA